MEARRAYRRTLRRSRLDFRWAVDRYRVHHERAFWRLLRTAPAKVVASLESLFTYFSRYFGIDGRDPLPGVVWEYVRVASHVPFTRDEVCTALLRMPRGKSAALAVYTVDILRGVRDTGLYDLVARVFDLFAVNGYPS